jgi:hypothetical protein
MSPRARKEAANIADTLDPDVEEASDGLNPDVVEASDGAPQEDNYFGEHLDGIHEGHCFRPCDGHGDTAQDCA